MPWYEGLRAALLPKRSIRTAPLPSHGELWVGNALGQLPCPATGNCGWEIHLFKKNGRKDLSEVGNAI